jgi:hypothetical protein
MLLVSLAEGREQTRPLERIEIDTDYAIGTQTNSPYIGYDTADFLAKNSLAFSATQTACRWAAGVRPCTVKYAVMNGPSSQGQTVP